MHSSPGFWAPHLQSQITMSSSMVGQVLFFRERFYIYAVSLIFKVLTFFFLKEYSSLQSTWRSQMCLAQRELPTDEKMHCFFNSYP